MYMYYIQAKKQPSTIKSTITQLLFFFIKDLCTLSHGPDIEPLSCQNLIGVGLCEGKVGCFDVVVVFIILFFRSQS